MEEKINLGGFSLKIEVDEGAYLLVLYSSNVKNLPLSQVFVLPYPNAPLYFLNVQFSRGPSGGFCYIFLTYRTLDTSPWFSLQEAPEIRRVRCHQLSVWL